MGVLIPAFLYLFVTAKDTLNKPRFSGADQAYLDFQGNIARILFSCPAIGAFPGDSSPILLTQDGLLPPEVFPICRDRSAPATQRRDWHS